MKIKSIFLAIVITFLCGSAIQANDLTLEEANSDYIFGLSLTSIKDKFKNKIKSFTGRVKEKFGKYGNPLENPDTFCTNLKTSFPSQTDYDANFHPNNACKGSEEYMKICLPDAISDYEIGIMCFQN